MATTVSDSYYYQHLHHLSGLQAGTKYHFRIQAQGYDGALLLSGDYTFTTLDYTAEVVRIPEDLPGGPPYTLDKGNTTYVLTQDLDAPTLAINIRADNVTVDLNGHTITYDMRKPVVVGTAWNDYAYNEEASFGIRTGLWNYMHARVFNGIIRQGSNGGQGFIGVGFNPIYLNHTGAGSQNEVAAILIDYYGDSVGGMVIGGGKAHHNVIIDRGTVVDDRHQGIRANGFIHHNEIYADSFDTNSFLIAPNDGTRVEDNKLFGTGYNPVGIAWANDLEVKRNFIYMQATAPRHRSDEYPRLSGVAGLRLTVYDNDVPVVNVLYTDNTIVAKAWDECHVARGIWTSAGYSHNVIYRNNFRFGLDGN